MTVSLRNYLTHIRHGASKRALPIAANIDSTGLNWFNARLVEALYSRFQVVSAAWRHTEDPLVSSVELRNLETEINIGDAISVSIDSVINYATLS